jgi:hypothetical protein
VRQRRELRAVLNVLIATVSVEAPDPASRPLTAPFLVAVATVRTASARADEHSDDTIAAANQLGEIGGKSTPEGDLDDAVQGIVLLRKRESALAGLDLAVRAGPALC